MYMYRPIVHITLNKKESEPINRLLTTAPTTEQCATPDLGQSCASFLDFEPGFGIDRPYVGLMLGHRRRRWPNINPTQGERLLCSVSTAPFVHVLVGCSTRHNLSQVYCHPSIYNTAVTFSTPRRFKI